MTDLQEKLRQHFGFDHFLKGQEEVISRLLQGKSVLAVFPTGAGKSICYQLPALLFEGLTVVVSPLIALMKDQIDFLTGHGVQAARLDSTLSHSDYLRIYRDLNSGVLKLLYISPERLSNERFLQTIARIPISLVAIDEAHCISEWGHNFRPDYLKIAFLVRELKVPRVLALTATATPYIAGEVRALLGIEDVDEVRTGFYRPNLNLHVVPCNSYSKDQTLLSRMRSRPQGPSIVYVTLRDTADEVAEFLSQHGVCALAYHAGMDRDTRSKIQERFMASSDDVIVATIAFGMGVDKSNIRSIYHYNLPKSLESYSQEIGRAGRDGKLSVCEMLACDDDAQTHRVFARGDRPCPIKVDSLTRRLLEAGDLFEFSESQLSAAYNMGSSAKVLLSYLELDGIIKSVGHIYTEYKCRIDHSDPDINALVSGSEKESLTEIFAHGKNGPKWTTLNVDQVSDVMDTDRKKIVSTLTYFESHGFLELQTKGPRQRYRRLPHNVSIESIVERMNQRFKQREAYSIARIRRVLAYVHQKGCRTKCLVNYFGEPFDKCGHCDRCNLG